MECIKTTKTIIKRHFSCTTSNVNMTDTVSDKAELRFQFSAHSIEKRRLSMINDGKCFRCYLMKGMCVCGQTEEIFAHATTRPKANFSIFMHNKEWGRGSNTGKLLAIGLPDKAHITLFGAKQQEEQLIESLKDSNALILYPSKDSKNISEYREWYQTQPNVTLVVLDSTWSQSQAMNNHLPANIPRVRIDSEVTGPSLFLNRKQSDTKTKVSTIEAVALALRALGESEDALNPLFASLQLGVDAVLQQGYKEAAYGHKMINKDVQKPTAQKPDMCSLCGAKGSETNFKNVGMHKFRLGVGRVQGCGGASSGASGGAAAQSQDCAAKPQRSDSRDSFSSNEPCGPGEVAVSAYDGGATFYRTWKCPECKGFFEETVVP